MRHRRIRSQSWHKQVYASGKVGSNVPEIKTRARRDGDHFIINGEKRWVSNGVDSGFLICTCRRGDDPHRCLRHFLLDRMEHPYESRNIHGIARYSQSTAQIFLTYARATALSAAMRDGLSLDGTRDRVGDSSIAHAVATTEPYRARFDGPGSTPGLTLPTRESVSSVSCQNTRSGPQTDEFRIARCQPNVP